GLSTCLSITRFVSHKNEVPTPSAGRETITLGSETFSLRHAIFATLEQRISDSNPCTSTRPSDRHRAVNCRNVDAPDPKSAICNLQWRKEAAMKTILVPLDGSALAERVLPYAQLLARTIDARLH